MDGEPVGAAELQPWLMELAGGTALQELVIDRRLAQALSERRLALTPEAVERERDLLARTLAHGAGPRSGADGLPMLTPDELSAALARLRRERGLGDARFAALLRRSAGLRLLVQDRVDVRADAIQQAYAIAYGERVLVRIIVVPTQGEAAAIRDRLLSPEAAGDLSSRFSIEARTHSIDPSAVRRGGDANVERGAGAIEPFSCEDPAYPSVIRQAARALAPGAVSPVLALDRGYALLLLEGVIAPTRTEPDPSPEIRAELESMVRLRLERLQMDRAASELLGRPGVSILDRSLEWNWRGLER
ncbi:MAG: peptidylprolyl isomerase [Phycisphaerales bacterium]